MSSASQKFVLPVLVGLLLASGMVCPVEGATGFTGLLQSPASFVSPYDEMFQRPSVALSSKSSLLFGYPLRLRPSFIRSSFFANSLTFNSVYYRQGRIKKFMIPVSVDALQYVSYRKRRNVDEKFSRLVSRSITDPGQGRRTGGLGITVGLPKRLSKIFGEGGAGLRVSGYRRIMFSGRSQWNDAAESEIYKQSKFPSLNMEQRYRFDINGTIGTKISVKVSEDSEQDIPLANRLIIRYKGDEDDILKSIEAGNTTLSLPRTRFVGYSSNIRGLFGIKSEAQMGRLRLIGIASQEQGSSERMSISTTGEESAEYIRDYNYAEARIFDLGDSTDFQPGDSVLNLFVYEQVDRLQESEWLPGFFAVDPSDTSSYSAENINQTATGGVKRIDQGYLFFSDPVRNQHYIHFNTRRRDGRALGVYMEIQRAGGIIDTVGRIGDTLLLKLLYHSAPSNQHKTWGLMWRNCYEIPRGVSVDDIDIKVFKGSQGNEGTSSSFEFQEWGGKTQSLLEILGLDQYNNATGEKIPDGKFDERLEIFRPDWGLLIFPHRRPFAADTTYVDANGVSTIGLVPIVTKIYDYSSDNEKSQATQYFIQIVTKARSNVIRLGKPNIIEGSERVTVNGQPLQRGVDYNIQYDFGQITLTSDEANDPNADIDIQFEYAPFLAMQKKTLLGLRAEYIWSKDLEFGTTVLYKSDKAQDRKPRVGQETARAMVYAFDGSWRTKANFLTSLADALPLIETEVPSNFRIEGELAQSRPNPNVDGVAYVDDFEAAQEQLSLGTQRTTWKVPSWPVQADSTLFERGKILWHAPRNPLDVREVWDVDPKHGEGTIRTLRLVFRPNIQTGQSWAGIMRGFYQRLDAQRVQLLELRVKISDGARSKLHIDIGKISEDWNGNGIANTEDNIFPNGALEEEEDVGLDGLADWEEEGYDPDTLPDPNGDNWYFLGRGKCPLTQNLCEELNDKDSPLWDNDSIYYEWLNGTEGNRWDAGWLGIPDEETLNRMGGQNLVNAYYSFVIDFLDIDSFRVEGSERNGWWTYRIPIRDSLALDALVAEGGYQPEWNEVSHVRVWFESDIGQTQADTIEIAAWYFVQSNWQDSVIYGPDEDSVSFLVASVSEEDHTFSAPPGVEPYHDPNYDVTEAQRGLLLKFENLDLDDTCLAIKKLFGADQYSGYRRLEMYVYGGIEPAEDEKIMFFFRLGANDDNYYEQRRLIYEGWDERNHINFDFNEITALKDAALRNRSRSEYADIDTLSDDGVYRVRGNPSINDVKYFTAGIINIDSVGSSDVTGEIWLDELRVTDVRKDVGTAGRVSVNGSIADLMSYNFSLESKGAFFRGLSSPTRGGGSNNLGSGKTSTRVNYGGSLNLDRFLPKSWGARIPISISHSKSTETPLLRNNSDIVLPEDVREEEKSVNESNSFRISESFNRKGKNPLFNLLLNRFNSSISYSRSKRKTVTTPYAFGESYSVNSNFNLGVNKVPTLPIFFWMKPLPIFKKASESRLGLYPSTWTLTGNYGRSLSITDDINYNRRSSLKRDFTGTMNVGYKVFQNLTANYKYSTTRDLSNPDEVNFSLKNFRLGLETRFSQSFNTSYNPGLIKFLSTSFSYGADYRDDYSRSSESRQSVMSRRWSVGGTFEHLTLLGSGKSGSSAGRYSGRHRGGRQGEDDSEEKPEKGKPFYDPPLAVLRFLTSWIKPVTYSYSEDFRATLPGMLARPEWKYRFGFRRETDVPTISEGRTPNSNEGEKYSFSSGFSLFGGLSIDVKYGRSINRDLIKQGTRYKNVSTSWPGLTIRIQKFRSLPLIGNYVNKFIDIFAPRTGYRREVKEVYDIDGGFLTSQSVTINHNPLLSLNFKLWRSLSLSTTYTLTKSENEKYNPTSGAFQSESRTERRSLNVSTKYSFSAPGGISIPIFGKLRFKSTMSISVDVKRSSDKSETRKPGVGWVTSKDKADFSVTPNISYTFSNQIKGGLRADWRDSYDHFRNRNTHSRLLEIWVEIRF